MERTKIAITVSKWTDAVVALAISLIIALETSKSALPPSWAAVVVVLAAAIRAMHEKRNVLPLLEAAASKPSDGVPEPSQPSPTEVTGEGATDAADVQSTSAQGTSDTIAVSISVTQPDLTPVDSPVLHSIANHPTAKQ